MSRLHILKATGIVASATGIASLLNLARVKAAALILGAEGIALIGIYQNYIATSAVVFGIGIPNRIVATVSKDPEKQTRAFGITIVLAAIALVVLLSINSLLLKYIFEVPADSTTTAMLAFGAAAAVGAAGFQALLQSLRVIKRLSFARVMIALSGAVLAVSAIASFGAPALPIFVVVTPFLAFGIQLYLFRKSRGPLTFELDRGVFVRMAREGLPLMLATAAVSGSQLYVRTELARILGIDASGLFHAAWAISMNYMALILSSLGLDYYPRLSSEGTNRDATQRIVNEQAATTLSLLIPATLAVAIMPELVLQTLYSSEFSSAADLLRTQLVGDVLRCAAWPLGFVLLARGATFHFLVGQLFWAATFAGTTISLLEPLGLVAPGVAYLLAYGVVAAYNVLVCLRLFAVYLRPGNITRIASGLAALGIVLTLPRTAAVMTTVVVILALLYSLTGKAFRRSPPS